jgi:branched-subunit amino acid ABC-type transport system permease component
MGGRKYARPPQSKGKGARQVAIALQTLFTSLVNGSVFALMGVAVVLCYRGSRIVNLAQGETYTVSGFVTVAAYTHGIPLLVSALLGIVAAGASGMLLERVALRTRLHWEPGRLIMVTLGAALLVEGVILSIFGANQRSFPGIIGGSPVRIGGAAISRQSIMVVLVALFVTTALIWFFRRTLLGQAMTAVAEKPRTSALLGINVARMRQLSFGIAGLLGGLAAVLVVPLTGITYGGGLALTLNGFVPAAFANMTSPGRALVAGLALGLGEGYVGAYINPLYETPLVFGVFLLLGVTYLSRSIKFGGVVRA